MRIEDLVIEQQDKVSILGGGERYGHDFNILKSIMKYHEDKVLVCNLVDSLEDAELANKVRLWMDGVKVALRGVIH